MLGISGDGVSSGNGGTLPTEIGLLSEMTAFQIRENSVAGECSYYRRHITSSFMCKQPACEQSDIFE
jgi:hypothetical protein